MTTAGGYAAVQEYLFSLKAGGPKFGLDRMRVLAAALGHPERAVPVVHIAGTNGKGSTAAMVEAIFREAGWVTGLYTSPHLIRLGERVQVGRQPLGEAEIVAYVDELRPIADAIAARDPADRPSFFEFMTAMAFLQFVRRRCDVAVVEVGLGGRLDATNIVDPVVTAITSIGLDHCEELGDSIAQIAAEKAGIVKPGRPVVIGRLPPPAEAVIRAAATSHGCQVISVRDEYADGRYPPTNLAGKYQEWNAATATLIARQMPARWNLSPSTVETALRRVDWPGRWQSLAASGRTVILDSSHNEEGAEVLGANLAALIGRTENKPIVVVGSLGQARARAILAVAARHASELLLVVPSQPRALSQAELEKLLPAGTPSRRSSVDSLFPSPATCTIGRPGDTVVVTGSIYLVGEVLHNLSPSGGHEQRLQDF